MIRKLKDNPQALMFSSFQIIHQLAIGIVVPFFSIILLEASWSVKEITYFFAIITFAMFLFSPVIGKLSDEFGRKKIMIVALIFQLVLFFLYFFYIENKILIYFLRFFDGIVSITISIVILSSFEDMIKNERGFWTGLFLGLGTIGTLIGPVVAGFVAERFMSKFLLLFGGMFAFFATLFLLYIPEIKTKSKKHFKLRDLNPLSEVRDFLSFKELQGMAFIGILMNAKGQIYMIFFPIFVITTLGLQKHYLGILLAIPVFLRIFQFWFGKIADSVSAEFGTLLGVFISAFSIFFLPYVESMSSLVILLICYGIGGGIWNVNAWSLMGRIAKKKNMEGEVVGTYVSLAHLGMFFTTLVSAFLIDLFGISRTLQLFAITIIVGNVITYFFFKPIFHHSRNKSHFHLFLK